MKRLERGTSAASSVTEAAMPTSVDFFGSVRASATTVKGAGKPNHETASCTGKAAKRARGADGRAQNTHRDSEERPSADLETKEMEGEDVAEGGQGGSDQEDEGVVLFSGGEKSNGSSGRGKPTDKKTKKAAVKSAADASAREEIAVFRRQMRISVSGDEVPPPAGSFEEMHFPKEASWLRKGIEAAGWKEPTPIQMQAVPVMLERRDMLGCAPTGSGKTGAFVIPLFALLVGPKKAGIRGLIISPTRELATQIYQQCQTLRAHSKMECKLLTKATAAQVADVQNSLSKKYDVLVSTPARVVSLLQARALDLSTVQVCIIDEADKLFEDGFVAQIDEVLAGCTHKRLQKALFSATIPPAVEELAKSIMPNPATVTIGKKVGASTSISQKLVYCGTEEGKIVALRNLVAAGLKPPVLVFVQSVERAKQLFRCIYLSYIYTYISTRHATRPAPISC